MMTELVADTPLDPANPVVAGWAHLERRNPKELPTEVTITRILETASALMCGSARTYRTAMSTTPWLGGAAWSGSWKTRRRRGERQ